MKITISVKVLCIIASVLIGLSVLFPFISANVFGTTISASLIDGGDGIFFLVIAAIALIVSACEKYKLAAGAGIVSFGLFIFEARNITHRMEEMEPLARSLFQRGPGFYLLAIASIALIVCAVLAVKGKKTTISSKQETQYPYQTSRPNPFMPDKNAPGQLPKGRIPGEDNEGGNS